MVAAILGGPRSHLLASLAPKEWNRFIGFIGAKMVESSIDSLCNRAVARQGQVR